MHIIKRGEKTALVILEKKEASLAAHFEERNIEHFSRFDVSDPILSTVSFWEEEILMNEKKILSGQSYFFHLVDLNDTEHLPIGFIYLSNIKRAYRQSASLSFGIDAINQGKGLMKEGLSLVINYAFEELNLHKVFAQYHVENIKSKILLEKLGFQLEGVLQKELIIRGKWEDLIQVAIFNRSWKSR